MDGDPAGGGVVGEHAPQFIGEPDAPGGAGSDLLAGDEAVVEPAEQGGGRDLQFAGGLAHVERLSFVLAGGRLVAGDVPVGAQ